MLIGRQRELAAIEGAVAAAREGRSTGLLLVGDPGIGKSTLLAASRERAAEAGLRTLVAHGVESERDLAFAGIVELFSPAIESLGELPEVQRSALATAMALEHGPPPDRFAIGAGVLGMLSLLANGKGLLVTVDDVQWLDPASREAILFATRRLGADGVAVVVAARPDPELDISGENLSRLDVDGLEPDAAERLLRESASQEMAASARHELLAGAAGNPLALIESPRALNPEQLAGREALPRPIKPSGAIERSFRSRLGALDDEARAALVIAAAAEDIEFSVLAQALRFRGLDPVALGRAESADIVETDGHRVRFTHPVLRAVAYHLGSGAEGRAAHAALAEALPAEDVGRRALHLAESADGPDEEAVEALLAAASDARERGALASSGELRARAAALTADPQLRFERTLPAVEDLIRSGQNSRARALTEAIAGDTGDVALEAERKRMRGLVLIRLGELRLGRHVLGEVADEVSETDPATASRALLEATICDRVLADYDDMEMLARRAEQLAQRADPPDEDAAGLARMQLALVEVVRGNAAKVADSIEAEEELLMGPYPSLAAELTTGPVHAAVWAERFAWAEHILSRMIDAARARGAPSELTYPLCVAAQLDLRRGRFELARAYGDEAVRLARETQQTVLLANGLATLADIAAAVGDEEACRAHADQLIAVCESIGVDGSRLWGRALGVLALLRGDAEEALPLLAEVEVAERCTRYAEPRVFLVLGHLLEAQIALGLTDDAERTLARLERAVEQAGGLWTAGVAARGRGLLRADDEMDEHFGASVGAFEAGDARFEEARSLLLWGERLRRARRRSDSRVPLRRALSQFERLGAMHLAERARRELEATGESAAAPRRELRDELTPHELRIGLRVAEGRTNPEVAAELFISRKTVEHHLSQIYRKLGVRSRTELARVLAPMLPEHPTSHEVAVGAGERD